MNKKIGLWLIAIVLVTFCSCGRGEEDDGKALLTADTTINVTSNAGVITLNEDVAVIMLGVFSPEHLGLSDSIETYDIEIGATKVFGNDACLVEAYADGSDTPEGVFAILGQECYVYKNNKYMLLTVDGPIEVVTNAEATFSPDETAGDEVSDSDIQADESATIEGSQGVTTPVTAVIQTPQTSTGFKYNVENDKNLKQKFSSYSKETLGIEKDLNEYVLIASGSSTTALDGETVFIVHIYEQDGTKTSYKLGITDTGAYKFSDTVNKFDKLN